MRPIVRQALRVVLLGAGAGVGAALLPSRLLRSVLFDVKPTDVATYGVVVLTLVLSAALASYLPARRAAGVDPSKAIAVE